MTLSVRLLTSTGLQTVTERVTAITATDEHGNTLTFERPFVPVALEVLSEARIYADYSQKNAAGTVVKNLNAAEPTANLVPFPSGQIVNEIPNANVVLTNYANGNATKIVTSGTNRSFYILRPSQFTPAIPNGTLSVRWRMRSCTGKGSQTFDTLFPGSNTLGQTVTETWTTFEQELTYAGSGDLNIRFSASDTQVEIDQLQVYQTTLASMPSWASEVHGGVRKAIAHSTSLTTDGNGAVDTEAQTSGLIAIDPDFPARHTYSEITVLEVRSVKAGTSGGHMFNYHPADGGTTSVPLLVDNAAPYVGEINSTNGNNTRSLMCANLTGKGVFVSGIRRSATERSIIIGGTPVYKGAESWAGVTTSRFLLDSFSTTHNADLRANTALGKHVYTVIWDRALTDDELAEVSNYLRKQAVAAGHTMAQVDDPYVFSGDSNNQRSGSTDYSVLIGGDGYHSPAPNLVAAFTSVGGQGLDDLERDKSGAESGLADGTITNNGRWRKTDKPILLGWAKMGFKPTYAIMVGTNDWDLLNSFSGTFAQKAATYAARVNIIVQEALAAHPNIYVNLHHLLPQLTANGREDWENIRPHITTEFDAIAAANARVTIIPFGTDADLGSYANLGTNFGGDGIHLNSTGDGKAAAIIKTQRASDRTLKGL